MILIGDENIECKAIQKIRSINDISTTLPNCTLLYPFDFEMLRYTQKNNLDSAIIVSNLKEVIYAASFIVKYIILDKNIAKQAQNIADNYMFDSKILVIIETNDEIVSHALDEIDGVIYKEVIENGYKRK